jgi:cytochrome c peroxidase
MEWNMDKAFVVVAVLMTAGGLHLAHTGDADKGKTLFESTALGRGTTGKSCATCHDGGKARGGDLFDRKKDTIMAMSRNTLADVVNVCIQKPLGGGRIDPRGEEMTDLIAFINTLIKQPERE